MTPKEKAEDLVKKFTYCQRGYINPVAKQCALIAVDEVINLSAYFYTVKEQEFWVLSWEKVKTEIKSL
jgi:hypothetical protein